MNIPNSCKLEVNDAGELVQLNRQTEHEKLNQGLDYSNEEVKHAVVAARDDIGYQIPLIIHQLSQVKKVNTRLNIIIGLLVILNIILFLNL